MFYFGFVQTRRSRVRLLRFIAETLDFELETKPGDSHLRRFAGFGFLRKRPKGVMTTWMGGELEGHAVELIEHVRLKRYGVPLQFHSAIAISVPKTWQLLSVKPRHQLSMWFVAMRFPSIKLDNALFQSSLARSRLGRRLRTSLPFADRAAVSA